MSKYYPSTPLSIDSPSVSQSRTPMAAAASDLHVAMLPWSAFGHMIPFHQLATSLAKKGVRVSYISTPRNIARLPKIPPNLVPFMQYVSFPLPAVPGLPEDAEATVDVEYDEVQYLKMAYDLLYEPLKQFVSNHSPDWVISDFVAHWLPDIATECQVQLMFFSIFTATFVAFTGPPEYLTGEGQKRVRSTPESLTMPPHWGDGIFPRSMAYRSYEAPAFFAGAYEKNASGKSDVERLAKMLQGCQAVGIRSCREFEGEYIDLYQTLLHKPVVPAGVLPPGQSEETDNAGGSCDEAFKWLDQQSRSSVVFVGFGSEYKLTKHEVYEIAHGLEQAELPFIWTLRRPTWAVDDSEALPPGFLTRTSGKGIVCLGWAPQLRILAHPSVGASLYHCGYATTVESLQHGHSLILLPCFVDQGLNTRLFVEKGVGIEVERREDGSYTREDIAHALRRAMIGCEADRLRTRTRQATSIFGNQKLQEEYYIGNFVEFLRDSKLSIDK